LMVQDGSLTSAKIQNLNVDKIVGDTASFVIGNIGYATIDFAKISNTIQSDNFQIWSTGWRIDKSGYAVFSNIFARGNIEASSLKANTAMVNTANIIDASVRTLKIGANQVVVPVSNQASPYVGYGGTTALGANNADHNWKVCAAVSITNPDTVNSQPVLVWGFYDCTPGFYFGGSPLIYNIYAPQAVLNRDIFGANGPIQVGQRVDNSNSLAPYYGLSGVVPLMWRDTIAAGATQTYNLLIANHQSGLSGQGSSRVNTATIFAVLGAR
jgi:hypothetical protein